MAGAVGAVALAACGGEDEAAAVVTAAPAATKVVTAEAAQPQAKAVTIRYLDNPGTNVQELNAKFGRDFPNVTLEVVNVPQGEHMREKLITSFAAGGGDYDLFLIDIIDVPQFAVAKWAMDISALLPQSLKDDVMDFAKEGCVYKGRWYGAPAISEWKTWTYNLKMINDAGFSGPPATWDEYVEISKAAMDQGIARFGQHWGWKQGENLAAEWPGFVADQGGVQIDENDNLLINDKYGVAALEMMVRWLQEDKILDAASLQGDNRSAQNAQLAGDSVFGLHWGTPPIVFNNPEKSQVVDQTEIGQIPHSPGSPGFTMAGPMGWSITATTKNPDEAWAYVNARAGLEGSKFLFIQDGTPFGYKSLWNDADVIAAAVNYKVDIPVMSKQSESMAQRIQTPFYNEFSAVLQLELQNALTLQKEPQAALDEVVKQYDIIKEKAGF